MSFYLHPYPVLPGLIWSKYPSLSCFFLFKLLPWFLSCNHVLSSQSKISFILVSSVHSVISNSLWPHELQHARLPCPSPTPGAYSDSCPSSWWCHPTISSSVIPFSSHLQYFPASGSFPVLLLYTKRKSSILLFENNFFLKSDLLAVSFSH